jgi:hypothetical protein
MAGRRRLLKGQLRQWLRLLQWGCDHRYLVHGASDYAGHGPGVDTILSTREGRPGYEIVEKANIVDWWGPEVAPTKKREDYFLFSQ